MEIELIEKLKRKNPESIKMVISKYNKKLFSIAYRFTNNADDAEDILQVVWMKFFNSINKFKSKSSLYTYLYRITTNESLMWLRKNKIKNFILPFKEKAYNITPESEYLKKETAQCINSAIDKLPSKQKKIFILRKENIPFKEIAEMLNIQENNAKTTFFYALKKVKNHLKELNIV